MNVRTSRALALITAGAAAATSASAQTVLIDDDFEVDTSADYTIVDDGAPDGAQTFAFDYVAAGLPQAPNSDAGDTSGLLLTANDTGGATDAWTCFHNTVISDPVYIMQVDVYMNYDPAGAGTTEFGHVGVGGDAATFNSVFTPISGSGAFIAFTGDGGSSSDYRWFRDTANTPMGETDSTTLPNSHYSYLNRGSNAQSFFFETLFPAPPSERAGSPGNIWTTVEILVDNNAGVITFFFDGAMTYRGLFANTLNGNVSLGIADVFTSLGATQFTVFDNLIVETLELPGTPYCTATANSTLNEGVLLAVGSDDVSDNSFELYAGVLPQNQMGFFIASQTQDFRTNPGGSDGNICLGGAVGRFVGPGQIQNTDRLGAFSLDVDLTMMAQPTGLVPVVAGETWNFQAWHRDTSSGGSNFTHGTSVTFQ